MRSTCCVPNCNSRRSTVKLHRIPKTDKALKWVTIINSPQLNSLSPGKLHKYYVCHRHFETKFVKSSLRLNLVAYPTLFTDVEIETGIPDRRCEDSGNQNNFQFEHNYIKKKHEDHTYSKICDVGEHFQAQDPMLAHTSEGDDISVHEYDFTGDYKTEQELIPDTMLATLSESDEIPIHKYEVTGEDNTKQLLSPDTILATTSASVDKHLHEYEVALNDNTIHQLRPESPQYSIVITPKNTSCDISKKKLTAESPRILKESKKHKSKIKLKQKIKRVKLSKNEMFEKITRGVNPLAKQILWMQVKQCTKKTKGRRFTDEEKHIALEMLKECPQSYIYLRKIFLLPSIKTINKMMKTLPVEEVVNPQTSSATETEKGGGGKGRPRQPRRPKGAARTAGNRPGTRPAAPSYPPDIIIVPGYHGQAAFQPMMK